eukprot:1160155-Pelagomonas_calceolata.AAC.2
MGTVRVFLKDTLSGELLHPHFEPAVPPAAACVGRVCREGTFRGAHLWEVSATASACYAAASACRLGHSQAWVPGQVLWRARCTCKGVAIGRHPADDAEQQRKTKVLTGARTKKGSKGNARKC